MRRPDLPRIMGKLTAETETVLEGDRAFDCSCSCGRERRVVRIKTFDRGGITACRLCQEEGSAPNLKAHLPPRKHVALDWDTFALLGVDLSDPSAVSSNVVRSLLAEYAGFVRDASRDVPLTGPEWNRLREVAGTEKGRRMLDSNAAPAVKTYALGQQAGMDLHLSSPQSVAVLSSLRWGIEHPDETGRWWEPDNRTGDLTDDE